MRLWAGLGRFYAPRQKAPLPRVTVYADSAGNRTKLPAGKRGIFYDRADGCFIFGRAVFAAFALGGTGDAAPGGAAAGSGGHRLCRRLGGAVRGADALWAWADPWSGRGLLCPLRGRGGAGAAAPRAGSTLAAQPVSAVCAGRSRGGTLAAAAKVCTRRAGGLRYIDRHGAVFCAGQQRRGRPFAVQRGGRIACGEHRLWAAQIRPGAPGHGHAAGGRSRGGGAGQCAVGMVFARGIGVCRRRAGAVLPGTEVCRPERKCGAGRSPLRRRPCPCPGGSGAGLCHGSGSGAGTRTAGGDPCRLRGRVRVRGALRAAARKCLWAAVQRLRRHGGGLPAARRLACPGGRHLTERRERPRARPQCGGIYPAGSRGAEPFLTGGDGERGLRGLAPAAGRFPLGHR